MIHFYQLSEKAWWTHTHKHTPLCSRRVECFHVLQQWHLLTQQTDTCKMDVPITHLYTCMCTHAHSTPLTHARSTPLTHACSTPLTHAHSTPLTHAHSTHTDYPMKLAVIVVSLICLQMDSQLPISLKKQLPVTDHSIIPNPWAQEFNMSCTSLLHEHWTANTATRSYQGSDIPARARRMLPIQF